MNWVFDIEEEEEDDMILTDKIFVKFLKENNAYEQFIYNLKYFPLESDKIDKFCEILNSINYITSAFDWSKTNEQFFWCNLHEKWINYLQKNG